MCENLKAIAHLIYQAVLNCRRAKKLVYTFESEGLVSVWQVGHKLLGVYTLFAGRFNCPSFNAKKLDSNCYSFIFRIGDKASFLPRGEKTLFLIASSVSQPMV